MSEKSVRPEDLDWNHLGFGYVDTDYSFRAHYKDGKWSEGELTKDNQLTIGEASAALHYGLAIFEGLKAFRTKEGEINIFRPEENGKRMIRSAERLMMAPYPVEDFVEAVRKVVKANEEWLPPYDSGASLYIRPNLIGVGNQVGVGPAPEYLLSIFVTPVGAYFPKGLAPTRFITSSFDRAAPKGTGAAKAGGNYASGLMAGEMARAAGYGDAIYLDPATHQKIEEVGSANFFGITADNRFVTPESPSVLAGITRNSLMELAEKELGMTVEMRPIEVAEFTSFVEAGACGTAAGITPIAGIQHEDAYISFYSEKEVGPVTKKLYSLLTGIQKGDIQAPEGWIMKV